MSTLTKAGHEEAHTFNHAIDKINEVQSRLTFLMECAPLNSTASMFTKEGVSGMAWMISDIVDSLTEARDNLEKILKMPEVTA